MLNRSKYFDYIEERLTLLIMRIQSRGKLNILDLNIHCESFYPHFLNLLFDWKLENLNSTNNNAEAVDLIDHSNKIIAQVSATDTRQKVESTLSKSVLKDYTDYTFKFVSIAKDTSDLKNKTFANPHGIAFDPVKDVLDKQAILKHILSLEIGKQKTISTFINKELGKEADALKSDSNLAVVINILSKEDLTISSDNCKVISFDIENKIEYNQLNEARSIIDDYKIQHLRLDKTYQEFDMQGLNKSYSVLQCIRRQYIEVCEELKGNPDKIFFKTIENVQNIVLHSANYVQIPIDELALCVSIVVVDAFIRCKIFKSPEGVNYATS